MIGGIITIIATIVILELIMRYRLKKDREYYESKLAFVKKWHRTPIYSNTDPEMKECEHLNLQLWINMLTNDVFILTDNKSGSWQKLESKCPREYRIEFKELK